MDNCSDGYKDQVTMDACEKDSSESLQGEGTF